MDSDDIAMLNLFNKQKEMIQDCLSEWATADLILNDRLIYGLVNNTFQLYFEAVKFSLNAEISSTFYFHFGQASNSLMMLLNIEAFIPLLEETTHTKKIFKIFDRDFLKNYFDLFEHHPNSKPSIHNFKFNGELN